MRRVQWSYAFEGVVHGFDDLAQRLEEPGARPLRLALAAGRSGLAIRCGLPALLR
jgi:hypothetical protein